MPRPLMIFYIWLVSFTALVVCSPSRHAYFSPHSIYAPKSWKLIPRSVHLEVPLKSPLGITPDDYFDFIPPWVGNIKPGETIAWSSACFGINQLTFQSLSNSSANLVLHLSSKSSLLCDSGYLFGYVAGMYISYYEFEGNHDLKFSGPFTDAEYYDLQNKGVRVFNFTSGVTLTSEGIFETVMLFFGGFIGAHIPEWTAEENLQFLSDHMGVEMPERTVRRIDLPKTEIKSGDFLGVLRLDGLDPLLAWGMGSRTGHTCITLWKDGELYVAESTVKSAYWPTNGIQVTPWDTWLNQAEAASYNVIHLPLDPAVAKNFDVEKAWAYFQKVQGLPYGFHNMFTGWVDTEEDNYPPPLTSHLVELLAPFAEWILQKEIEVGQTYDFLTQGLNLRLGTKGLSLPEAYMVAHQRGLSFADLVTLPEQDSWIFVNGDGSTGPSMVCDVLVLAIWKAAGIFGNLVNSFQAAEFTNWDAYSLKIFDSNYQRPQVCKDADPDIPFCQILGKYTMNLTDYNTFAPFPNMRQRCPSLPPDYKKDPLC